MSELKPTYGDHFILAFDYEPPGVLEAEDQNILYINSIQLDPSQKVLARLQELYPKAKFSLLKNASTNFPGMDSCKNLTVTNYTTPTLPPDFHTTEPGRKLLGQNFSQVFFGLDLDARPEVSPLANSFAGRYDNIFNFIVNSGLYDRSYAIDNQFAAYPCPHLEHLWRGEQFIRAWDICGHKLPLPWTQLALPEKETLFQLAESGSSEGAIVNVGNFLGGSSIILAKGSKLAQREKVFSFDLDSYAFSS